MGELLRLRSSSLVRLSAHYTLDSTPAAMSSPSLQRIRQSITHQTSTWPKDVLRPQVQFSTTLQTLVDQRLDGFEQRGEPVGTDELEALDGLQKALRDLKSNRWRDKVSPLLSIQPVLGADFVADPNPPPTSVPPVPLDRKVSYPSFQTDLLFPHARRHRPSPAGRRQALVEELHGPRSGWVGGAHQDGRAGREDRAEEEEHLMGVFAQERRD